MRGDLKPAIETHEMLYQVTKQHKFLPEVMTQYLYSSVSQNISAVKKSGTNLFCFLFMKAFTTEFRVHWGQHLLRPEFAESTYYLYKVTLYV